MNKSQPPHPDEAPPLTEAFFAHAVHRVGLKPASKRDALEALKNPPPGGDFVWDAVDEDDRPLTAEEMRAGIAAAKKRKASSKTSE